MYIVVSTFRTVNDHLTPTAVQRVSSSSVLISLFEPTSRLQCHSFRDTHRSDSYKINLKRKKPKKFLNCNDEIEIKPTELCEVFLFCAGLLFVYISGASDMGCLTLL